MKDIDIERVFYHGIIDWLYYQLNIPRDDLCFEKLESILKHRFIYRPCSFKKNGITHDDYANPYTHYFTFVAFNPKYPVTDRYDENIEESGFSFATEFAKYGILISPTILEGLQIYPDQFCNHEIIVDADIPLDKYGIGIYVNPNLSDSETIEKIYSLLRKSNYDWNILNINDGKIIYECSSTLRKKCSF